MSDAPRPTPQIEAVPATTPFVAPEELAKRAGRAELLRLGANESAFGPPPGALAAMRAAVGRTSWYGDPESLDLRAALAQRHGCLPQNIAITSGIDDLLGLVVRCFLGPGDVAVQALGTYPTFGFHVTGYGGHIETVRYDAGGTVPLDALAALARDVRPRVVYLANPDNPSGSFHPGGAVTRFLASLPPDALLMLDEAYADFLPARDLAAPTILPRTVRARTFSKAYGMAGARIAYALADSAVVATFQKIRLHYGINRTAQIGALAALDDPAFIAAVIAEVARGRDEYYRLGARLGIGTLPSTTNFVLFDLGTRERAEAMLERLLQRGVFVRKPSAPPLDRYVRVSVGSQDERARFEEAFAAALDADPVATFAAKKDGA